MQIFEFFGKLSLWASPEGKPYSKLALAFESKYCKRTYYFI
jgi:hypothetical protein